jgi:hypothetical protein
MRILLHRIAGTTNNRETRGSKGEQFSSCPEQLFLRNVRANDVELELKTEYAHANVVAFHVVANVDHGEHGAEVDDRMRNIPDL